ncbi:MAG TPA: DUF1330 domain-containing protein [Stellaceae bacterium]|nr:DUF1330 domain-containing protein [Stellaceae bacterium]
MPAYFIVEVEVTDPAAYERYKPLAGASVARHGGKFLVRGGRAETLEGGWEPKRIVVLEFPSMEAARRFYDSPDYQEALKLRLAASRSKAILVEGG